MPQDKSFTQFIYGLVDPLQPEHPRYVGRTNDIDMRLRTHVGEADYGFSIKDVWIMYLRYDGRKPELVVIEQATFDDKKAGEVWAKNRERHWIMHHAHSAELFNGPQWSGHPIRKPIPKGIKAAWCETHVLLWELDCSWEDELRLLEYLNEEYGAIIKREPQPDGSVLCESMAGIPLAQSQYKRRRFRTWSVLRALLSAHPALAIGDLETVNLPADEN